MAKKEQNDKQRSIKHTHKPKDRLTRIPLRPGGELRCSGRVAVPAMLKEEKLCSNIHIPQCNVEPVNLTHMFIPS